MPLDFNSYRAFQLPVKPPDSPLQIAQDVATLKDTQALSQERQALLQDRQQKLQQEAQDRQEQGQMQAVLAANQGDITKAYPQMASINASKADAYLKAHLETSKLQSDLQDKELEKRSKVADFGAQQLVGVQSLPPEERQHGYDVARAQINAARSFVGMPPATEDEMSAVYDPAKVQSYIKSSATQQKLMGAQAGATPEFFMLPNDPTPHLMKKTKDGQVLWQGQDVSDQVQPFQKEGAEKGLQHVDISLPGKGNVKAVFNPTDGTYTWNGKDVTAVAKQATPASIIIHNQQAAAAAGSQNQEPSNSVRGYMDDITSGALKLTDVPAAGGMRNSVVAQFKKEGYDLSKPITAQAQARVDLAKMVLPQVAQVQALAEQINKAGLMGTLGGRARSLFAHESAADAIAGLTPQQQQLIGQFVTQAELLSSGTVITHYGARAGGGAASNLREQLDPKNKSLDTFLGNLKAVQSVLGDYAKGMPGATKQGGAPDAAALRQKYQY